MCSDFAICNIRQHSVRKMGHSSKLLNRQYEICCRNIGSHSADHQRQKVTSLKRKTKVVQTLHTKISYYKSTQIQYRRVLVSKNLHFLRRYPKNLIRFTKTVRCIRTRGCRCFSQRINDLLLESSSLRKHMQRNRSQN